MTISIIALLVFREILELWGVQKRITLIMTIVYALVPVWVYDDIVLTESLSLSGTVIFIYVISKYINNPSILYGSVSIFISELLTFIRPTFVINIIGLLFFYILRLLIYKNERRTSTICILICICSIITINKYALMFCENYGIYTLSATKTSQDYITTIFHNLNYIDENNKISLSVEEEYNLVYSSDNPNLISVPGTVLGKNNCNLKSLSDYVHNCKKHNLKKYLRYYIKTFYYVMPLNPFQNIYYGTYTYNCDDLYTDNLFIRTAAKEQRYTLLNVIATIFGEVKFEHIYLLILIMLLLIKNKKNEYIWLFWGLIMFQIANILLAVFGTCGEFGRKR